MAGPLQSLRQSISARIDYARTLAAPVIPSVQKFIQKTNSLALGTFSCICLNAMRTNNIPIAAASCTLAIGCYYARKWFLKPLVIKAEIDEKYEAFRAKATLDRIDSKIKNIVLIFKSRVDPTKVLETPAAKHSFLEAIKKIEQSGCQAILVDIDSIKQMNTTVKALSDDFKLVGLWIQAHGDKESGISITDAESLSADNMDEFRPSVERLHPKGAIVIQVCEGSGFVLASKKQVNPGMLKYTDSGRYDGTIPSIHQCCTHILAEMDYRDKFPGKGIPVHHVEGIMSTHSGRRKVFAYSQDLPSSYIKINSCFPSWSVSFESPG